ncbi:hypothetical protein GCM10023189_21940 [Nibrella saemangeumensis]|uniref:PhoD-like phosphatase metallophosphatase domain-containing protein n=1 Tax=Nibrella saemangeumensis TaxID=1084526 RepID=A0ABP8MRJ0_9BACT
MVIGGQVINPARVAENFANYAKEREQLIQAITQARIPGVLFLTGDRHHTILHQLDRSGTYPLYDLTVSPLTSGTARPGDEDLRQPTVVNGTLVTDHNFAILDVTGPLKDRVLSIKIFDANGTQRWTRDIRATDLR